MRRDRRSKTQLALPSNARYALCGMAVGVVVAGVVYAPATWLCMAVEHASAGQVRLLNPTGSLWSGSAAWVLASGAGGSTSLSLPSRIAWQIRPAWSGLQVSVAAACCSKAPVHMRLTPRALQIAGANVQMPLALLQGLGTPWNTLELRGDVHWQWEALHVSWASRTLAVEGMLEMQARNVSSRLSTLPDVGSYQLKWYGGAQPRVELTTLRGALLLSGHGHWENAKFRFQGEAQALPEQASELANLLTLLGTKRGNTTMIRWG